VKIKLDENLPQRVRPILQSLGHDVADVAPQIADWPACFFVLTENKLRIKRPGG